MVVSSTKITVLICQSNDVTAAASAEHAYETVFPYLVDNFRGNVKTKLDSQLV